VRAFRRNLLNESVKIFPLNSVKSCFEKKSFGYELNLAVLNFVKSREEKKNFFLLKLSAPPTQGCFYVLVPIAASIEKKKRSSRATLHLHQLLHFGVAWLRLYRLSANAQKQTHKHLDLPASSIVPLSPQMQIHNEISLSNSLARFCKTRGLPPWRELCRVHTSFPAPAPPTPRRCWKKRLYCLRWGSGKHEQH